MKVAIYARVSTDKQDNANQLEQLREFRQQAELGDRHWVQGHSDRIWKAQSPSVWRRDAGGIATELWPAVVLGSGSAEPWGHRQDAQLPWLQPAIDFASKQDVQRNAHRHYRQKQQRDQDHAGSGVHCANYGVRGDKFREQRLHSFS